MTATLIVVEPESIPIWTGPVFSSKSTRGTLALACRFLNSLYSSTLLNRAGKLAYVAVLP